ncbi:prophage LambdaBa01, minor structural protein [Bacillus anthracis str. CDC 684]|nr:prophage LambdaBa01, minor structural protein [Bacillus anthracis str. CDC 684]
MGNFEKGKDMTFSVDLQNDVYVTFLVFQFINGSWTENLQTEFPAGDWSRRSFTFQIDGRATGWGMRLRFARLEMSKGKRFRFKRPKLEKGSVPTDFSKSTYELEQSVNGIRETITKVENNQSGFDKRVTAVEKNAEGITQNVSKIQEMQTEQSKKISEAQSIIKQHSDQIDLTIKKKDMEDYVGGLGSINEVRNAGLNTTKFWNLSAGTVLQPNSIYKGYPTFWSDYSGKTSDHWSGAISDFISVTTGESLVSTGWFATDNIASLDQKAWMEIEFYNGTKSTRMRTQRVEIKWIKQGDWVKMTMLSTVAANEEWVRWRYYVQRNGRLRAGLPMLQRGKVATEFWLHPKDQVDADKMLEDIANRVATEQYNQKMTQIDNRFSVNEKGIDLVAKKTEVYTQTQSNDKFATNAYVRNMEGRIQVTEKNILSTVKKGEIISSINQTAEKIKISANLIDLVGRVEASWLKAGLLQGMTIKTSATKEYLHMENQVIRFVNQGSAKIVMGFEDERKSTTRNPYIILGEGDGTGRNIGSIYKDGNGVYYRYVDYNGAESNIRLTNAGNIGITAQDGIWFTAKRVNFTSPISTSGILFNSFGKIPLSQQGVLWMGNGYRGFGAYYHDGKAWNFISSSQ